MTSPDDCIFCRIAAGSASAHRVYEDAQTVAFLDIRPAAPGHTLIIPRLHSRDLLDAAREDLEATVRTSQRVARGIYTVIEPDGIRVAQFNGTAAGQTVFHYHLHLVPVRAGTRPAMHGREDAPELALVDLAARLRAAIETAW
jgi:histidine triad (HIT) family protein